MPSGVVLGVATAISWGTSDFIARFAIRTTGVVRALFGVQVWGALLLMTGALLAVTGALLALGLRKLRNGIPPAPETAIEEAKLTARTLASNGSGRTH